MRVGSNHFFDLRDQELEAVPVLKCHGAIELVNQRLLTEVVVADVNLVNVLDLILEVIVDQNVREFLLGVEIDVVVSGSDVLHEFKVDIRRNEIFKDGLAVYLVVG